MKPLLAIVASLVIAAPASAFTFFSIGATTGPGPGDPGLAAFENALVTFDAPMHSGVTNTVSGSAGVYTGTSNVAAAPVGDTGAYQALGTGGASLFDFRTYFTGKQVRSLSVYVGSVDTYNFIDVLDSSLNTIGTISGSQLPGNNGDQGASITNRRLYINFATTENVGGLRFRSDGVAFEYDTIGASSAIFTLPPGNPTTPPVLPPATSVPEPAAWALMIAGFVMTGFASRRRGRAVAA